MLHTDMGAAISLFTIPCGRVASRLPAPKRRPMQPYENGSKTKEMGEIDQ